MSLQANIFFEKNYYRLSKETLNDLHNPSSPSEGMVRFRSGLENFVFGVMMPDNPIEEGIHLLYAEEIREFRAYAVPIPLDYPQLADEITTVFAREITYLNPEKDFITVFNTFQTHRETALENLGYTTFNPFEVPSNGSLVFGSMAIPIQKINRLDFLMTLYGKVNNQPHLDPENKIYLMVDTDTGFIKIGRSKNPKTREKTLQSEKPKIHIICSWTAPAFIEKELHNRYRLKRKRGEWFNLTLNDLDEIKMYMDNL